MSERTARRSNRNESDESFRLPTRRDRDRILYSDPFRRLDGVTQVASSAANLHNRLTHSLKVEQVGASLVTRLSHRGEYSDVLDEVSLHAVQAACLAHDLGHPPFGHAGEVELHRLVTCGEHFANPRTLEARRSAPCGVCKLEDGFEGNAQSFRIITALEQRRVADDSKNPPVGLDLTRISLAATSKYPWVRGGFDSQNLSPKTNKWGAYDCDTPALEWTFGSLTAELTIEAQVMDWADDISYAVHDIEDFYRMGLVPLNEYQPNSRSFKEFLAYISNDKRLGEQAKETLEDFEDLLQLFPQTGYQGEIDDSRTLDNLRSRLITQFINAATLAGRDSLKLLDVAVNLNAILKQLIWYHVIDSPKLARIQTGQAQVLADIFGKLLPELTEVYAVDADGKINRVDSRRLPSDLRRAVDVGISQQKESGYSAQKVLTRALVDYIASRSDAEAYDLHSILRGNQQSSYIL